MTFRRLGIEPNSFFFYHLIKKARSWIPGLRNPPSPVIHQFNPFKKLWREKFLAEMNTMTVEAKGETAACGWIIGFLSFWIVPLFMALLLRCNLLHLSDCSRGSGWEEIRHHHAWCSQIRHLTSRLCLRRAQSSKSYDSYRQTSQQDVDNLLKMLWKYITRLATISAAVSGCFTAGMANVSDEGREVALTTNIKL